MSGPSEPLDPVTLSALLASRLCHDLINPIGAIGSGLEVLAEPDMDPEMKETALTLIESGGSKSIALLKYGRLAYGAAGGFGAEIPMEEAAAVLKEVFALAKAELDWRVPGGLVAKEKVKTLLILAFAAADCVPRGGVVAVSGSAGAYRIEATGPRVILQEDLARAAGGDASELKPKYAPAYIAGLMTRAIGGELAIALDGDKVVMSAKFTETASLAAVR